MREKRRFKSTLQSQRCKRFNGSLRDASSSLPSDFFPPQKRSYASPQVLSKESLFLTLPPLLFPSKRKKTGEIVTVSVHVEALADRQWNFLCEKAILAIVSPGRNRRVKDPSNNHYPSFPIHFFPVFCNAFFSSLPPIVSHFWPFRNFENRHFITRNYLLLFFDETLCWCP